MPTVFPIAVNNLEAKLASGYTAGQGSMIVRAADAAALTAAAISASRPLKFTAIDPTARDLNGRLIDPTRTAIFTATGFNAGTNTLTGVAAAGTSAEGDAGADRSFPVGSVIRCQWTAGMHNDLATAINTLETTGVAGAISARFGSFGEYKPPVLADAQAAKGSIYFGSDHLDGNGQPKLCRKDSVGTTVVLG